MPWPRMHARPVTLLSLLAALAGAAFGLAQVDFSAAAREPSPPPVQATQPPVGRPPAAQAATRPRPRVPPGHAVVHVRTEAAFSERPGGPATLRLGSATEFGSPRVLGVAARRGRWLGVVTTERPNNELAWVRRGTPGIELGRLRWSLHADLSRRQVALRRGGRTVHRLTVAIGRPGSDTPTGRFAVTDKLRGASYGAYYGCCILALSGRQPNLPAGWTGGDRLAIHGTDSPATIGAPASAGCLRAGDADLELLMAKVPLGTPVFVRR
jgi:lipoprotein-anchoring transpeptidase ErfK/SrfK